MIATDTLELRLDHRVLDVTLNAPPLNLIGPEMVRDLVKLVHHLESHDDVSVVVFRSASPDFFSAHVDMYRAADLGAELAHLEPGAPLGALYRRISTLNLDPWMSFCDGLRACSTRTNSVSGVG